MDRYRVPYWSPYFVFRQSGHGYKCGTGFSALTTTTGLQLSSLEACRSAVARKHTTELAFVFLYFCICICIVCARAVEAACRHVRGQDAQQQRTRVPMCGTTTQTAHRDEHRLDLVGRVRSVSGAP